MTNADPDFYDLLGPFLARRSIVKELGAPVWDDDDKTWVIAMRGKEIAGFVSVRPQRNGGHLSSVYVRPEYRGSGIFGQMLDAMGNQSLTAMVPAPAVGAYIKAGFRDTGATKNFRKVCRP